MSKYSESVFQVSECHLEGCNFDICTSNSSLFSIGNDDVFCQYSLHNDPNVTTISNPNALQLWKIACNAANDAVAVATETGSVLELYNDSNSFTVDSSRTIYKSFSDSSSNKVKSMTFTENGEFLLIATHEPYCIVYEWKAKKFFKHKLESETQIASITVDHRNQYFCVIDYDGKATVYEIDKNDQSQPMDIENDSDSQDPFAEMNAYRPKSLRNLCCYSITAANSPIFKKGNSVMASFNHAYGLMTETLYLPGRTVLQKIELSLPPAMFTTQYEICKKISHLTDIQQVVWFKNGDCGLLLTGTQIEASIWLQNKSEKLINFNLDETFGLGKLIRNICVRKFSESDNWGFVMVLQSRNEETTIPAKVYDFKAFSELSVEISKQQSAAIQIERNSENKASNLEESSKKVDKKKFKHHKQENIASKLLNSNLTLPLTTAYERVPGCNARFLFCNNIGCVIERFLTQDSKSPSTVELDLHDRSKISRLKIPSEALVQSIALCSDTLVYSSTQNIHIQCEKHLKQGFQWEYEWYDIEGVAIGGEWICAINKEEIKVWDWVGNQLHSVSFDRKFFCMAAYEDLLAVVFLSSIPMFGVSFYKMLIFEVTSKTMKCIRQVMMPSKPEQDIKWFGFSEEGMLCCKDDAQNIRVYMFERDEWIPVNSYDPLKTRMFIQHIQNYEIFGFKLDQKFPSEPKVLPRSLPKKQLFDLTDFSVEFLTTEENEYIKKHKLQLMWLQHQKFRNARWFKHKYSRRKDNRWYSRAETIKSEEEIKGSQAQMDLKLLDYFKKYIKLHREEKRDDKLIWNRVLVLCSSLAFYNETRNKLSEALQEFMRIEKSRRDAPMAICSQYSRQLPEMRKTSICQLDRLEEMMGLPWVNMEERGERMEIEF